MQKDMGFLLKIKLTHFFTYALTDGDVSYIDICVYDKENNIRQI